MAIMASKLMQSLYGNIKLLLPNLTMHYIVPFILFLFVIHNVLYFDIKDLKSVKVFCIVLTKDYFV